MLHKVRSLILPEDFLDLQTRPNRYLDLDDSSVSVVLAVLAGQGVTKPTLIQTDDQGRVLLGASAAALPQYVRVEDAITAVLQTVYGSAGGDADAGGGTALVRTYGGLFNGATWDRTRSLSAANLAAQSGLGGMIVDAPGQWVVASNPAAGSAASASRAAGAAGVRHVLTGIVIVLAASTALGLATLVTINIRDGATGVGTILGALQFQLAAAVIPPTMPPIPPLNIPGSPATAMTVEGSAGVANLVESILITGYDVA